MPLARRSLVVAALLASFIAPCVARAEEDRPALSTRVFAMKHVDVKEMNAMIRSLHDVRKTAVDEERQVIIARDTPETLDAVGRLIAELDRPPIAWRARLVALDGRRETTLREFELGVGSARLEVGRNGGNTLQIELKASRATVGSVQVDWHVELDFPPGNGSPAWREAATGSEDLENEDGVTLVEAAGARREALAGLLGREGEVSALKLVVSAPSRK